MDRPIIFITEDGRTHEGAESPVLVVLNEAIHRVERTINEPTLSIFRRSEVRVSENPTPGGKVYRIFFMTRDVRMSRPVMVQFEVLEDRVIEMPVSYLEGLFTDMIIQFVHQIRRELLLQEERTVEVRGFWDVTTMTVPPVEWRDERSESNSRGGDRDEARKKAEGKKECGNAIRVVRIGLCSRRDE